MWVPHHACSYTAQQPAAPFSNFTFFDGGGFVEFKGRERPMTITSESEEDASFCSRRMARDARAETEEGGSGLGAAGGVSSPFGSCFTGDCACEGENS